MPKIRVLVVDDSVVIRRLVTEELSADPALEVVGTAANGRIALAKMTQVNPDLVILDVEMPEMDGLATLARAAQDLPAPAGHHVQRPDRARGRGDARRAGPRGDATISPSRPAPAAWTPRCRSSASELIPEIKALCKRRRRAIGTRPRRDRAIGPPAVAGRARPHGRVEVVAIGDFHRRAERPGRGLSPDCRPIFPVPIVIVQHMPPMFTRLLAERLSAKFAIPVEEAAPGVTSAAGPGLDRAGRLPHDRRPRRRASADCMLQPGAAGELLPAGGRRAVPLGGQGLTARTALAVVLTGMGQDGLRGCEAIREAGGQVLVQDEATSVVWGMPGYVARAGLADRCCRCR